MEVMGDKAGEQVKYDLSKYDYIGLHQLMLRLGFPVKDGEHSPAASSGVTPLTAARLELAIPARPNEARSTMAAELPRIGAETNLVLAPASAAEPSSTLGLREAVRAAITSGDDLLARGFMADGGQSATRLKVLGGGLCVAAIIALLFCCRSGDSSRAHEHGVGGLSVTLGIELPHTNRSRYTPLSPVIEVLTPGRASELDKNV
ncbi:hypothetical protein T492DRAFT_968474 [Pavlovales sp. CCMP2436]|nr:hypothetical protein T492DRAFT_968474 [Pavlovales sp. CCMP2436]|mmetsp:Transcript_35310/g.88073  ORF Transcript_35310/g.88073 Transcript_35310/m.88073 type:complete len:204 (-) Transcript_35310:65-676(-)